MDQTRVLTDPAGMNFSRKISTDLYRTDTDSPRSGYGYGEVESPVSTPSKEKVKGEGKQKKRWWQSGKPQKRALGWVEGFVKSGSRGVGVRG